MRLMFQEESLLPFRTRPAQTESTMSRREFIKSGLVATAAVMAPLPAFAARGDRKQKARELKLYNLHTHERLSVCYRLNGKYDPAALKEIDYILRDHRSGDIKPIDTRLLDLLHSLSRHFKTEAPFHIISGYRSPKTNSRLRRNGRGVASKSMHMLGKAIDIRLPDVKTSVLRDTAIKIQGGGVGYYAKSDFVHVDVGRVRFW